MDKSLDELVADYQEAEATGNEESRNDVYCKIHEACKGVAARVIASFKHVEIADFEHSKLLDCIRKFRANQKGQFAAYYRKSLHRKAIDLVRHSKRRPDVKVSVWEGLAKDSGERPSDFQMHEDFNNYVYVKRQIIDGLEFKSAGKMSTLLLDQRQRVANLCVSKCAWNCEWVERVELWHHEDKLRKITQDGPLIQRIWEAFASAAELAGTSQTEMVGAMAQAGYEIDPAAWRQRVSRYLRDVQMQVDKNSFDLFHQKLRS